MDQKIEYLDMLCARATEGPWEFHAHDGSMISLSTKGKLLESEVFSTSRCESCQDRKFRCHWPRKVDANFIEAFSPPRAAALMKLAQAAIALVQSGYDGPFMGDEIADLVQATVEVEAELESVKIQPTRDAPCEKCNSKGWLVTDESTHSHCGACRGTGWVDVVV